MGELNSCNKSPAAQISESWQDSSALLTGARVHLRTVFSALTVLLTKKIRKVAERVQKKVDHESPGMQILGNWRASSPLPTGARVHLKLTSIATGINLTERFKTQVKEIITRFQ
jgi:hypothetical protein